MRALLFLVACLDLITTATPEKIIYCVFGPLNMGMSDLNPTLCTHLSYNRILVKQGKLRVVNRDSWSNDIYTIVNNYRQQNPSLKILMSLWGAKEDYVKCTGMVLNSTCREQVADNIAKFAKWYGFDGVNLLWWSVGEELNPPEDEQNLIGVLSALRTRCDEMGLTLSSSVHAPEIDAARFYNVPEVNKYFDFITLLGYDWQVITDQQTGTCAALQARFDDKASDKIKTAEACTMYWLNQGVPREKLIVGLTALGCTFTLNNPNESEIGATIIGAGVVGHRTNESGILWYNEICELQKSGGWNVVFDEDHRVPYTFKGNQWITYDNVKAVREKAEFIVRLNLGGAAFTQMDGDDYEGICGEKYPLLKTLNAVLRNGEPVPEESLPVITPRPKCPQSGYFRDPHSCGLILCTTNTTGGYNEFYFECRPGNCDNPLIGKIRAESIDVNFFICGD